MPEFEAPVSGMLTVSIDGDRITRVSVEADETIEVGIDSEGDADE